MCITFVVSWLLVGYNSAIDMEFPPLIGRFTSARLTDLHRPWFRVTRTLCAQGYQGQEPMETDDDQTAATSPLCREG